ncbi:MAG: FHA domain-containing protein [Acidobacteria bacterium]|nr:FHA domain-containing protein [Acidobacteriota bacterium]
MASYTLLVHAPGAAPQRRRFSQPRVSIGRESGDLVLGDPQCSSRHAELLLEAGTLLLRDLGSTNGTWHEGGKVAELRLLPGMAVQIGAHRLEVESLEGAAAPGGTMVAPAGAPPEPPRYVLAIQAKGQPEILREFMDERVTIGRAAADILLADPACSTRHAELLFQGGRLRLRDLGSTNGTWLQGQRIQELDWTPGTTVRIGTHDLTLRELRTPGQVPQAALPPPLPSPPPQPVRAAPSPSAAPRKKGGSRVLWVVLLLLLLGGCTAGGLLFFGVLSLGAGSKGATPQLAEAKEATVKFVWFAGEPGPGAHGGTANARVRVGPNKSGTVSVGVAEEFAGGGGNQWRTATWLAAFNATRAVGATLADYEFNVHVGGHTDGPSAGMITTATMLALIRGKEIRADSTMTGTINPDGTAGPVGGIVQKMEGAKASGLKRFGFPIGCRNHKDMKTGEDVDLVALGQRLGLEAKEIGDLHEAYQFLTGDTLARPEPLPDAEMEPGPQTQALLRAKLTAWKARIEREIGHLKEEVQKTGVPAQLSAPLLEEADKAFATANRDERNGFLMPALEGYAQAAISVSVATRLTTAFSKMVNLDVASLMQAIQTAETVKGELDGFGQQLEVRAAARTLGGQINTTHAFASYVNARAAIMIADDFKGGAISLLQGIQAGKIPVNQETLSALLQRATMPTLFLDASRVFMDYAKDLQDLITDEGGTKALSDQTVDRTVAGYASASAAVLAYFDALITQEVAKGKGLSMEDAQALIASREMDYYLARKANVLSEFTGGGTSSPGLKLMRLAAGGSAFLTGAKLVNKWYSLGGSFNAQGEVVLENRRALSAQLDLARRTAREAAARAKASVGFVPTPARLAFQVASARREGNDDEKLAALANYWQATFWSEMATSGGR